MSFFLFEIPHNFSIKNTWISNNVQYNKTGDYMNYIKRDLQGIIVDDKCINTSLKMFLNKHCLKNGSTLQGRLDFSKWILNTSKLPIYINNAIILFPTKSLKNYETILINYKNIVDIYQNDTFTRIIFSDLSMIDINISFYTIKKQMDKCAKIVEFLQ